MKIFPSQFCPVPAEITLLHYSVWITVRAGIAWRGVRALLMFLLLSVLPRLQAEAESSITALHHVTNSSISFKKPRSQ